MGGTAVSCLTRVVISDGDRVDPVVRVVGKCVQKRLTRETHMKTHPTRHGAVEHTGQTSPNNSCGLSRGVGYSRKCPPELGF